MTKIENDIHEEMKTMIADKTDCMIESYGKVFTKTKKMFIIALENGDTLLSQEEVAKRTDMFWNIALQRIESDKKDVMREAERKAEAERRSMTMPTMPPGMSMPPFDMPMDMSPPQESPCAKKSRESAEKIAELEAEIKDK